MPDAERRGFATRLNDFKVTLLAVVGFLVGLAVLWVSTWQFWQRHEAWQSVVNQAGGLLVVTALLTLAWEHVGRRAFAQEIMATANLGADVERAGLTRVTDQYLEDVAWGDLMAGAEKVDILVAYAATWRNTHRHRLQAVASRKGTRLRVFLPDPDDEQTMAVLSDRFAQPAESLKAVVNEAVQDFSSLATVDGGTVEVYVRAGDAVFSCYRFDGRAVLTLYSHGRKRRSSVPTFVVRGGDLWQFVYEELQRISEQSRKVFPPVGGESQ